MHDSCVVPEEFGKIHLLCVSNMLQKFFFMGMFSLKLQTIKMPIRVEIMSQLFLTMMNLQEEFALHLTIKNINLFLEMCIMKNPKLNIFVRPYSFCSVL